MSIVELSAPQKTTKKTQSNSTDSMIWIPGGTYNMGSNIGSYPEEGPIHRVSVSGFWMEKYPVTNKEFSAFVEDTGYITFAEKAPLAEDYPDADPSLLVPGSAVFIQPKHRVNPHSLCWWHYVPGADWKHPRGPESNLDGLENHPVVQIVYEDAKAYADWAGKELPTEAQWEFAARGGLEDQTFAWGKELKPNGKIMANTWQGQFPHESTKDKPPGTEPVGCYEPNGYGLYDMIGNTWEWTKDFYRERHPDNPSKSCCSPKNPNGGSENESIDKNAPAGEQKPRRVLKGGSFLCAPNYCARYRPAARYPEAIDTSTNHIGFRLIKNV